MGRVLVIPDIHLPPAHPQALNFCRDLRRRYKTNKVVFIGDVFDMGAISFYVKNPNCPSASDEFVMAREAIKPWVKAFPEAIVTVGNHDERIIRVAESVGIPEAFLRSYTKLFNTPNWSWVYDTIIDDVYYFHGTGSSGIYPAFNAARKMLMSVVQGHNHSCSGIKYLVNPRKRIFAVDTGCLIDIQAHQFIYNKHQKQRPVLSAAVVIDGIPHLEILECGPGEKYHRSKK